MAIVDNSGSMGAHSADIVHRQLPSLYLSQGYHPDHEVTLIVFSSGTDLFKTTVRGLVELNLPAQGGTNFAGSIGLLNSCLQKQRGHFNVFVLTDGEIGDSNDCKTAAEQLCNHANTVSMVLCRLVRTSAYVDMKTLAMLPLHLEVQSGMSIIDWDGRGLLTKVVETAMKNEESANAEVRHTATLNGVRMSRLPFGGVVDCIDIAVGNKPVYLWTPASASDIIASLSFVNVAGSAVGSAEVTFSVADPPTPEELFSYTQYLCTPSALLVATGSDLSWFGKFVFALEEYCVQLADCTVPGVEEHSPRSTILRNASSRTKALLRKFSKAAVSNAADILRSKNESAVNKLNQQQLADWLRQTIATSSTAKGLVKRLAKLDVDMKPVFCQLATFADDLGVIEACPTEPKAVLSQATPRDFVTDLLALALTVSGSEEELCDDSVEILEGVGVIGIGITCVQNNYVDPFLFRVQAMQPCFLSTSDLVQGLSRTPNGLTIRGCTTAPINGLIPLRFPGMEAVFDAMVGKSGDQNTLVGQTAGFSMRRMTKATLPRDYAALVIAGILWIVEQPQQDGFYHGTILPMLVAQLKAIAPALGGSVYEIPTNGKMQFFTKPGSAGFAGLVANAGRENVDVFHSLVSLLFYHSYLEKRHWPEAHVTVYDLLGVDVNDPRVTLENFRLGSAGDLPSVLTGTEELPCSFNLECAKKLLVDTKRYCDLAKLLGDEHDEQYLLNFCDTDWAMCYLALCVINTKEDADRAEVAFPLNKEMVVRYLHQEIDRLYQRLFAANRKRVAEEMITKPLSLAHEALVKTQSMEEFREILRTYRENHGRMDRRLYSRVAASGGAKTTPLHVFLSQCRVREQCPLAFEKCVEWLTDHEDLFVPGDCERMVPLCEINRTTLGEAEKTLLNELLCASTYRVGENGEDVNNRHDFNNTCPSYAKRGHLTLRDYHLWCLDNNREEEWEKYLQDTRECESTCDYKVELALHLWPERDAEGNWPAKRNRLIGAGEKRRAARAARRAGRAINVNVGATTPFSGCCEDDFNSDEED